MPKPFIINKLTNISLHFLCNITSAFYFLLFVNLKKVLYNICIYIRDTHLHFTYASPNRHILCTFPVKIQIKENTMQLTQRAENIIKILARFPQDNPVTIGIISEELGISNRSIQRELPTVEKWLGAQGYRFVRKRSVGLILDEPEERRAELIALLNENNNQHQSGENRKERQTLLCRDLLFSDEPLKSFYFTDKFGISEGTLASTLNQLIPWFEKYHLRLVRRQGLGIFIEGSEIARRQAITSWLCQQINENQALGQLRKNDLSMNDTLFGSELPTEIVLQVNHILTECEEQLNLHLSDNGYLHLLVYISLSIHRMQQNHFIAEGAQSFSELSIQPEYAVSEYIMRQIRQLFHLSISVDETLYLAAYLSGQRIWPSGQQDLTEIRNLDVHQITLMIIKKVSEILHINFMNDERLVRELSAHIQPTIARLRAGIPIENPLLGDFQENYPDIYHACEEGMSLLCPMLGIRAVPGSETGFITIYFVMAKERIEKLGQQISVILVCPTGIGSSRLLASSLKKEYPDLAVRGITSDFEIDCDKLRAEGIDLIISTVKLHISYRYLHVNPILTRQDKMLLDSKIKVLQQQKAQQEMPDAFIPESPIHKEDVEYISALGTEIYQLLDNIRIGQAPVLQNRDEVISYASALFADTPEMEKHLYQVLKARDDLANTYIKPFHALLLHGRSPQITRSCFGYIRLEPPIYENTRMILGAIVSLIPSGDSSQTAAPVASEIIGALLEEPDLLKSLQRMDDDTFGKLLEVVLLRFYRNTVQSRLQ